MVNSYVTTCGLYGNCLVSIIFFLLLFFFIVSSFFIFFNLSLSKFRGAGILQSPTQSFIVEGHYTCQVLLLCPYMPLG